MSQRLGCFSLLVAAMLLLILPWIFADVLRAALLKLQLDPRVATMIIIGIFAGSVINIPVHRLESEATAPVDPLALLGLGGLWPSATRVHTETVVAVNVGGCLIPAGLAAYEATLLVTRGGPLAAAAVAILLNVLVCYKLARPVRGVGILMPGLVPPIAAALAALTLTPTHATPVAFIAGTLGPLVGADLLHVRDFGRTGAGIVSIGGAGTFDGILLSGIWALYLS